MRQARWRCARCVRGSGGRGLLQASWWRVEVPPPRRACHVAQASGGWLHRIGKRETKVSVQASGPVRSDVSHHCRSRCDSERRNGMSVVAHGTKPHLLRSPRDGVPHDVGRMSGADRYTHPASWAGEGSHSMRSAGAQANAKPCPGCGDESVMSRNKRKSGHKLLC